MNRMQKMVQDFHEAFEIVINEDPTLDSKETQQLRINLIEEEFEELKEAYKNQDLLEVADALGDLLYVVFGAAVSHGLDLDAIFREIHRSNMTKVGGHKGPDGKWIKPDSYSPANLTPFV